MTARFYVAVDDALAATYPTGLRLIAEVPDRDSAVRAVERWRETRASNRWVFHDGGIEPIERTPTSRVLLDLDSVELADVQRLILTEPLLYAIYQVGVLAGGLVDAAEALLEQTDDPPKP